MKQTILTVAVIATSCFVGSRGLAQVPEAAAPVAKPQAPVPAPSPAPTLAPVAQPLAKPVESLRVRQMFLDRDLIVAEIPKAAFPASVQIGDEFIATLPSGKQCALKVQGAQGVNVTLDTKDCRYKFDLVVGLQLERSLLTIAPFVGSPSATGSSATSPGVATAPPKTEPPPKRQVPESTGPYEVKFSDFSYMPKSGGFVLSPYIQRRNVKETYTINRTSILATDAITFVGGFQLEGGITDRMKLGVQIQHSFNDQTDFAYGPASTSNGLTQTLTDKGFFDPKFSFEFQALSQNESPMSGFVAVNVKPSFIEAKSSTTTDGRDTRYRRRRVRYRRPFNDGIRVFWL